MIQGANEKNAAALQGYYKDQDTALDSAYQATLNRAQAVSEKALDRQQQIDLAHIQAGTSLEEKTRTSQQQFGQARLDKMDDAAEKAQMMNNELLQMGGQIQNLPSNVFVKQFVSDHPNLAGMLSVAGVPQQQIDAAQLINGLTSYLGTQMKPAGLGAMREYEFDSFRAALPDMLKSPDGQRRALGYLLNLNDRIINQAQLVHQNFERQIPDNQNAGQMRPAMNLSPTYLTDADSQQGAAIPSYKGPPTKADITQWRNSIKPGRPYMDTETIRGPDGNLVQDASGNYVTRQVEKFAPLPGETVPWVPGISGRP
jgi:hypothetical protein